MSMQDRLEWSRQVAAINECIKGFQADPGTEQFEAAIAEMRSYADACQSGDLEIPTRFIAS